MPHLDLAAARFAGSAAQLAIGLLGETAGPVAGDGCPQGDPDCYAPIAGTHHLCQYRLRRCTDPSDGCPADALMLTAACAVAGDAECRGRCDYCGTDR